MASRRSTARPSATPVRSRRREQEIQDDEPARSISEHAGSPEPSQAPSLRPLPAYIPPSAPLNVTAVHALQTLDSRSETLKQLRVAHDSALESLKDAAASVYERLCSYQGFYERTQSQLAEMEKVQESQQGKSQVKTQPGENGEEEEEEEGDIQKPDPEEIARQQEKIHAHRIKVKQRRDDTANMKRKADEVHTEVEEKVRQVIDGKARLDDYSAVLGEVSGNVQRGDGRVAPTQSTLGASQFRNNQPQATMETEGDGEEAENVTTRPQVGAVESIKAKLRDRKADYDALSMRARYAQNNDYIGFRRMVHDAQHPEDGVTLSHSNTWFAAVDGDDDHGPDSGHQTLGGSDLTSKIPGAFPADQQQASNDQDSDSDIEIARERISTRCPLTLQELRDPVTAKACGHTFEASAVAEMIQRSALIIGGVQEQRGRRIINVGGEKGIRCPVGSCTVQFGVSGLHRDPAVTRKIKRQQERQREMEENGEYEGGNGGGNEDGGRRERAISIETIDSDDGSAPGGSRALPTASMKSEDAVRIKLEGRSSMPPPPVSNYRAGAATTTAAASMSRDVSVLEDDEMDEDYEDYD